MNRSHSKVTDWGLSHASIKQDGTILDVGCGGGRTVSKLAALATNGKVIGIDFSKEAVAMATRINRRLIDSGRVEIREASVSQLPFAEGAFDLVTAVETHFWWPDLPGDLREVLRVLKPGGTLVIIAEIYKGASSTAARIAEKNIDRSGMKFLTIEEHRQLLSDAGYSDIQITADPPKGWLCAIGRAGGPRD
jgi:ubiquinone/menaquinone biosynthesis C-methylase UbiE